MIYERPTQCLMCRHDTFADTSKTSVIGILQKLQSQPGGQVLPNCQRPGRPVACCDFLYGLIMREFSIELYTIVLFSAHFKEALDDFKYYHL